MSKVKFSYDVVYVTRQVLKLFIDKQNELEEDKLLRLSNNEILYRITDEEVISLLDTWSNNNGGKTLLFQNGMDDAKEMFEMIWKSKKYLEIINEMNGRGYGGYGVYDKKRNEFYPCLMGEHYKVINEILEGDYPELFDLKEKYLIDKSIDISKVDNFIMNDLALIGKFYRKESYTVTNRDC